ncbi:MAG: paraquat-inducible protein A [Phycisphaerae bacterium]
MAACPCCGLVQRIGEIPPGMRACCSRCESRLHRRMGALQCNRRTAAFALAGLLLYPVAVSLPMIRVDQFGHHNDASILEGTATLLSGGHVLVGVVVLLCSIVLPLGKLLSLLTLSAGGWLMRREHRALTYHFVEFTGRWGMLDVLLVAILVAVLKLGDMVEVSAGPAALAFTACVVLSLLASASFDPHSLWSDSDLVAADETSDDK